MALPTLADKINAVEDKIEKENIISEIAKAVFKSAKITTEAAAKFAVAPSVPQMVDDVLDDLKSGSIDKFNKAMDKLDKLVRVLGIDVNVLSQKEIESKQKDLRDTEKKIQTLEKKIAKDTKQVQDPGLFQKELKTTAQFNKKEEIKRDSEELEQKKKERDQAKQVLGSRGEEKPGIFQRASEGAGNFADEYIPDQIRDVAGAFTEGLTAPFTAIKELGMGFAQMLKPLKILKPLFTGLIGSLKKFALGLKASVVAFLPYLAIAALVVLSLGALFLILKKFKDRFSSKKDNKHDMGPQETDVSEEDLYGKQEPEKPKGYEGNQMRTYVYDPDTKKMVMGDDPRYDEVYKKVTGELIKSGNFMDSKNRSAKNLRSPDNLTRPSYEEKAASMNNIVGGPTFVGNNTTIDATGLSGAKNTDLQIFHIANPLYSN